MGQKSTLSETGRYIVYTYLSEQHIKRYLIEVRQRAGIGPERACKQLISFFHPQKSRRLRTQPFEHRLVRRKGNSHRLHFDILTTDAYFDEPGRDPFDYAELIQEGIHAYALVASPAEFPARSLNHFDYSADLETPWEITVALLEGVVAEVARYQPYADLLEEIDPFPPIRDFTQAEGTAGSFRLSDGFFSSQTMTAIETLVKCLGRRYPWVSIKLDELEPDTLSFSLSSRFPLNYDITDEDPREDVFFLPS